VRPRAAGRRGKGIASLPGMRTVLLPAALLAAGLVAAACRSDSTAPAKTTTRRGFGSAVHYGSNGISLGKTLIADLNGDGRKDVVVAGQQGGNAVLLAYYQNATGGLDGPTVIPVPNLALSSIAVGDLDGDGRTDVAVAGQGTLVLSGYFGRAYVFLQDPASHALAVKESVTVSNNYPGDIAIGDVNGDGRSDLVVSGLWVVAPDSGRLSVFYQQAGGTLGPETISDAPGTESYGEVKIADMNGDGRNDIVLQGGMLSISVLLQQGNGTLAAAPARYDVVTSYWPRANAFAVGDVTGDGKNDIVVLDPGNAGTVNLFTQGAGGSFTRTTPLTLSESPFGVQIADVDGDGLNDIVGDEVAPGAPTGIGMVRVWAQSAAHAFADPAATFTFATSAGGGSQQYQSLAIGDVTGDGLPDAVVSWMAEGIWVLPGTIQ